MGTPSDFLIDDFCHSVTSLPLDFLYRHSLISSFRVILFIHSARWFLSAIIFHLPLSLFFCFLVTVFTKNGTMQQTTCLASLYRCSPCSSLDSFVTYMYPESPTHPRISVQSMRVGRLLRWVMKYWPRTRSFYITQSCIVTPYTYVRIYIHVFI